VPLIVQFFVIPSAAGSDSDGGVEESAVSLRRPAPCVEHRREGHRFSRAAEALNLAALQRLRPPEFPQRHEDNLVCLPDQVCNA
jgi:hypothetical protein